MPGKRPRPLQRTQSIAHLNFDDNANQCSPLPEQQPIEKQKAGRGPVMCAARQVIGFAPKANVEIDFAEKKVPSAAAAAAGACSRPCGPQQRSGLCDLLSGPGGRPCWKKDAQTQSIGLGIALALEKEHEPCGGVKGVEHQALAATASAAAAAAAAAHQPVVSPPRTPKASTPIPIQGLKPRFEHPPVRTRPESFLSKAVEAEEQQIAAQALAAAEEESADGNKLLLFTALAVAATPPPKSTPAETGFAALHFLDACHFCKRIFGEDRDIYMYRGDKAFCSVECRHHQIVLDERLEKCSAAALAGSAITPARHMSHRNRVMAVAAGTAAAA